MLTWLRRLLGPPPPTAPRLVQLVNRVDDLEQRCDYLAGELKQLRGRVTGALRKQTLAEDAPGSTNGEEEVPQVPPRTKPPETAHLARRLRSW